jgi:multidrug resistance protein, MATE family
MPITQLPKNSAVFQLPAQRIGADGRTDVDLKAIIWLALPFILNSTLNAVLNLTDTWFIAQLSAQATAAMGAIYWASLTLIILLGGIAIAVQTFAAQAIGANSKTRAAHWLWTGLYGAVCVVPLFWLAAWLGPWALHRVGLEPAIAQLAIEYWQPRMWTAPFGTALWTMLSFINGIGKPKHSLVMNVVVAIVNALLNQLFMFTWGMGMAGAAWATGASLLIGLLGTALLLRWPGMFDDFPFARTRRFRLKSLQSVFKLGLPTGLFIAFDLIALAFFQLYQTQLGAVGGAATQIVMMLTSIAYMPAVGIGNAGNTLVAQSIGAGDREWAGKLGNVTIAMSTGYMASVGVLIALLSPWLMSVFVSPNDPQASEVIRLGITLAWIAAAYQFFDGLNISSAFCLRAAGDAKTPALMLGGLAWLVFIPLAQMLTFAPGKTWFSWLPGFGLGAVGGWVAACIYIGLLGTILFWRWRSGAWRKMSLR